MCFASGLRAGSRGQQARGVPLNSGLSQPGPAFSASPVFTCRCSAALMWIPVMQSVADWVKAPCQPTPEHLRFAKCEQDVWFPCLG